MKYYFTAGELITQYTQITEKLTQKEKEHLLDAILEQPPFFNSKIKELPIPTAENIYNLVDCLNQSYAPYSLDISIEI